MKSITLLSFLVAAITLFGCARTTKTEPEKSYQGHPIIGTWSFEMNNCTETYEFLTDGTRNSTSAEEVVQAAYVISANPSDKGFYKITDKITRDNGKRDCSGSTEDMTGDVVELYVLFNQKMDQIVFCLDESLERCVGPFRKKK